MSENKESYIKHPRDKKEIEIPEYELIDRLYTYTVKIYANEKINTSNIIFIMIELTKIVEKYTEIHGEYKKNLVLHVLKLFIDDHIKDEVEKNAIITFIDLFAPSAIDAFISIDKREISIKINKEVRSFFSMCYKKRK